MSRWLEFVNRQCLLLLEEASWEDPILVLRGPDWSLQCLSPWRLMVGRLLVGASDDRSRGAAVVGLRGKFVTGCEQLTSSSCADIRRLFR